jgi:transcriptional regulator with XRE-family HTH domain
MGRRNRVVVVGCELARLALFVWMLVIAGKVPAVRMWFMRSQPRARRRPTEIVREADRVTQALADTLGAAVKSARRGARLKHTALAERVGVDQGRISQLERGLGQGAPLRLWVALGLALGRPLAVTFSRPLGEMREPADAGHLAMQERLLELAHANGRRASFELPTRPLDPRRSIDVCLRDGRERVLIIQEAWNTFGDVGAAVRSTNRKGSEAASLAATIDDGPSYRIAAVWVVRPSAANRAMIRRYPHVFRSAFPGSSRRWVAALTTGAPPPSEPGLVWLDPGSGRVTAWRQTGVVDRG